MRTPRILESPACFPALVWLILGWQLRDVLAIAALGDPSALRRALVASLVVAPVGLLVAWLVTRRAEVFGLAVVATLAASLAPTVLGWAHIELPAIDQAYAPLPKTLFVALLAAWGIGWLARRSPAGLAMLAFGSGVTLASALVVQRALRWATVERVSSMDIASLVAGMMLVVGSWIPARSWRRWALASGVAVLAGGTLWSLREAATLRRPDVPVAVEAPAESSPNLVLITLDTVRATHLAPYGYERVTTPELDAFVEQYAVLYRNARSTSSWTLPSHASMLTGLLPSTHGATHPREAPDEAVTVDAWPAYPVRDDVVTLAERLAQRGYRTAANVGNTSFLAFEFGLHRGFEHYDDRIPLRLAMTRSTLVQQLGFLSDVSSKHYRDAESITRSSLRWLRDRDRSRPYFLFVNYMDAHGPYIPRPPFDRAFSSAQPTDPISPTNELAALQYDRELLFMDHYLGVLLSYLADEDDFDDTVIVVTSDHGEAFGEHGFWQHGATLYEEVIRVPLYVKPLGQRSSKTVETPISGDRLFGLMLEAVGVSDERAAGAEVPVIAEWFRSEGFEKNGEWPRDISRDLVAWLEGDRKVIVGSNQEVEMFDLTSDPDELDNLALDDERRARLRAQARDWWQRHPPNHQAPSRSLPEETERQLRALGYIQ